MLARSAPLWLNVERITLLHFDARLQGILPNGAKRMETQPFDVFITADYPPTGGGQSTYFELITRSYPGKLTVLTRWPPGGTVRQETVSSNVDVRRVNARGWSMPMVFLRYVLCRLPCRSIRFIHCGQIRSAGWACCMLNLMFGIPYGIHVYGGERGKFADRRFWRLMLKPVLRRASCFFAISRWTRDQWIDYGISQDKIVVITPAVDLQRYHPIPDRDGWRERFGLTGRKVLLTVCRLDPHKGTDKLIEAMSLLVRRVPDILLVIGGEGRMRERLGTLVQESSLGEYVRFTGRIPVDQLNVWYNAADVFVMPSRVQSGAESGAEGFGIVYLEANACGRPVVGGRSGGSADAVEDGVSGLLVDPESPAAIADAVERVLTDAVLAHELGLKGMQRANTLFRDEVISEKLFKAARKASSGIRNVDQKTKKTGICGDKPNVAHVITRLDKGGSATNTIVSADRQRAYGFNTRLIYGCTHDPDGSIQAVLDSRSMNGLCVPCLKRNISPVNDFRAFWKLVTIFRSERFDLVHTHTSKAGLLGRAAARVCHIPCVHTPHGHIFYGYFSRLITLVFVWMERVAARVTARIVSLTDRETEESLERKIGRPEQFTTIPSGVPLDAFCNIPDSVGRSFREYLGIPDDAVVMVSVGRLAHIKGFDILVKAFATLTRQLPKTDVRLLIVGDGEERMALEALVRERGLDGRVVFTGEMQDVARALKASDFFALASRNEGMGRAFVEAMASGLPVIGPNTGGVALVIRDGETGLLVEKEDEVALAGAMERLVLDVDFRKAAGIKAARFVDPVFSESFMLEKLCELYHDVLDKQNPIEPEEIR